MLYSLINELWKKKKLKEVVIIQSENTSPIILQMLDFVELENYATSHSNISHDIFQRLQKVEYYIFTPTVIIKALEISNYLKLYTLFNIYWFV